MLDRIIFGYLLLIASVYSADHDTFKDCSRVSFCSNLRSSTPDSNAYSANLDRVEFLEGMAVIQLNNSLELQVSSVNSDTFRIIIQENESGRYRLQEVLDGEPEVRWLQYMKLDAQSLELAENEESSNRVRIVSTPLSIQFLKDGIVETIIDGDRLVLDNTDTSQAFAFGVTFAQARRIYGIHEHADHLSLKNTNPEGSDPYRLRNLDVAGYELDSPMALYGSIPVLYGHGPNFTSGIFLHNAAEQWIEINRTSETDSSVYIMVESGLLDLFVLLGPRPKDLVRQYANLTGVSHLPQLWTLGYHQCRFNYDNTSDVKNVVANFDNYNLPLDAIWLDIEYTDGKRYFTWNPENFADPEEMQQNISATGRRLVAIIDPHIKVDEEYWVYTGALEKELFVKNPDGTVFQGDCWPGLSSYMDFMNPDAVDYYASMYSFENFKGSTPTLAGIWNDMNEPSVFDNSLEKTLPGDAQHHGGVLHRDVHNIYGLLHTKATHKGLMDRDKGLIRPFILTRSHFAGSQRYTAFWTGDNTANFGHLAVSYSECLTANILGLPFCGSDVGGFFDNPDEELVQRWYQAGAWLPFYRSHANMGTDRREPYLYREEVLNVIRDALRLRYKHIQVWYTLFYEHTRNGDPIIRPLFYQYPSDPQVFDIENQLLVGENILVRAVTESGVSSVETYFPGETDLWYSIYDERNIYRGGNSVDIPVNISSIPVFYRAGSIIVRIEQERKSTNVNQYGPYTLYINTDENGHAYGTVYYDDYESFEYLGKQYTYFMHSYENDTLYEGTIDPDTDHGNFFIDEIVVNEPSENEPGKYIQTVYTKTVDGVDLKDVKLDSQKRRVFKLK